MQDFLFAASVVYLIDFLRLGKFVTHGSWKWSIGYIQPASICSHTNSQAGLDAEGCSPAVLCRFRRAVTD